MARRQITADQARAIYRGEWTYYARAFRVLNADGKELVNRWLEDVAKEEQDAETWFTLAETIAANNYSINDDVSLAMSSVNTKSGKIEVLDFYEKHFDWMVND